VQVARRLTNAVRPADTVARLGGDEFAILCAPIDRGDELAAIAHRIRRALAEPVRLPATSTTIAIRGSIGTAVADAATTPDSLVRAADAAMYLDKRSGRRLSGEDKAVPV
jgi:diguanylate cyclase (GGDEF)-like protein